MSEEMSKEFTVSPSKITTYIQCNRKFWWENVKGYRSPPSASQARGTAAHGEIERFLLEGAEPTSPKLSKAVQYLPQYSSSVLVESWLNFALGCGTLNRQKVDLADLTDKTTPHVIDHKTSKNLRYALSEAELEENPQLLSYAMGVLKLHAPEATHFKLSHLQIPLDSNEEPQLTTAHVTREHVESQFQQIEEKYVSGMKRDFHEKNPLKVLPNWNHCDAYGGCPHRARCDAVEMGLWREDVMEETTGTEPTQNATGFVFCVDPARPPPDAKPFVLFISPVLEKLAESKGDWRLCKFGEGKGFIAQALREVMKDSNVQVPAAIFVYSREDLFSVALEVLGPLASKIEFGGSNALENTGSERSGG